MKSAYLLVSAIALLTLQSVAAQQPSREQIIELLEKNGCVTVEQSKVRVCKYDYIYDGKNVEAVTIRPLGGEKFPGLILLPGHQGTAKTSIGLATLFAGQGFACLTVSARGYGKSEGEADFMGPRTIAAFVAGFHKFRREPFVDASRMGVFGYSRGGMAASLLALKLGADLHAAVLAAGIYDFKRAYDETKFDGIRENMRKETGMTKEAIRERSSVLRMEKLKAPVLIIHGGNDENAPTNQALLLRDRLTELKKDFEIVILPDHKHGQLKGDFISPVIDFLSRKLKGVPGPKFH